ncbi:MAG: heat-inducible transcriptional repressor HrcA [Eubacteriales bacterium]|jgi:heat-inducible transcriptional repressor|nr:heat-inducible transcriptional repressor HrcA [Eubacteriales bacterium]
MELDDRKKAILEAVIESYIENAEPVGSRTIAKRKQLNISPATVRNEMADLEEMGLLEQPHTSAGRIPSDLGYRVYVDKLMKRYELTADEINRMRSLMQLKISEMDSLIREITNIYSRLINYTVIATMPEQKQATIKHFQIMPIDSHNILLIVVTDSKMVKETKITLTRPITLYDAVQISSVLNESLAGVPCKDINISSIKGLQSELYEYDEIIQPILDFVYECISTEDNAKIFYGGITNLLNFPEYSNINRARELLEYLDNKSNIQRVIAHRQHEKVKILIGSENNAIELNDCSVVLSPYQIDGRAIGTIGLIGPTRMNYSKAVSNIEFLAGQLNRLSEYNMEEKK